MKFTCSRDALTEAVTNVSHAVSVKSNVPVLEGILINTTTRGKIKLSAYNLELGITTFIDASISEQGSTVLSARLFGDIIRRLPNEKLSISIDENLNAVITSGICEFTIPTMLASEYPELPTASYDESITLSQPMMKSMIRQTKFAISADESRPVFTGTLFEISENRLRLVSIDGVKLAIRTEKIVSDKEVSFIVPGKTLSEIEKLLSDTDGDVNITLGKKLIIFDIGSYSVISRLLEGKFFDYNSSIPAGVSTNVRASTRELCSCMERASLMIKEKIRVAVKCTFEDNRIKVSCETPIGKSYDEIDVKMSGENVNIGFNSRFLIEALRSAETDEVNIIINGSFSPVKIVPTEGDSFMFLIMPSRMKG